VGIGTGTAVEVDAGLGVGVGAKPDPNMVGEVLSPVSGGKVLVGAIVGDNRSAGGSTDESRCFEIS
jgi:hypothetical protein